MLVFVIALGLVFFVVERVKNMFIDTFKTTADRIAFENRGKGITSPDVQSAIEEVYEKAVGSGGNGGNGGDDNVIVWVSKVSYNYPIGPHDTIDFPGEYFEIDVDPRFNYDNVNNYDHFLLKGPYLYSELGSVNKIDAEAMLTSVFFWDRIEVENYPPDPIVMNIQCHNFSERTVYVASGDPVIVLSVKK